MNLPEFVGIRYSELEARLKADIIDYSELAFRGVLGTAADAVVIGAQQILSKLEGRKLILDAHAACVDCEVLTDLASPFAHHADFDPAWATA